ncbi:hypothetical protein MMC27_008454 [Xylographa pallens]|nr:hypothetical protein [Xylographa pallens]
MDILLMPPPPDGDQDRGHTIFGLYWTLFGLSIIITVLRFYAHVSIRAVGWDDWLMLVAVLLLLGFLIPGTLMILDGGCRHLYFLLSTPGGIEQVITVTKLFYICQPFAIMCIATGRMSVGALLLKILVVSYWRKRFVWFTIVSTFLVSMLNSILLFAACTPTEGLWNILITANCWDPTIMTNVTIFTSSWNVLIDVCLALLPVTLFWNLNMSLKKRIALCFLMGGGLLAAISGAIKTSKLPEANAVDVTWGTYDLLLWNGAETFLVILCGSIPALKPIYDMCVRRQRASTRPLFSLPRKPTYKLKNIFPSLSTGDDSYVQLEPIQKNPARLTAIEVVPPANVDVSQGRGGDDTTALHEFHRVPWERTASGESITIHAAKPSREPPPAANALRGDDMV